MNITVWCLNVALRVVSLAFTRTVSARNRWHDKRGISAKLMAWQAWSLRASQLVSIWLSDTMMTSVVGRAPSKTMVPLHILILVLGVARVPPGGY